MDSVLRRAQQAEAEGRIGVAARLYRRYCADTTTPRRGDIELLEISRRANDLDQIVGAAAPPHLICPISLRLMENPVIIVETGQVRSSSFRVALALSLQQCPGLVRLAYAPVIT